MKSYFFVVLTMVPLLGLCQTNRYEISFENAVHHEAVVSAVFPNITTKDLVVQMSRTSPGRYAIHEFAKNVYNFKAVDSKGTPLSVSRPDPYSWSVTGHDGTVKISYTLFANRADGTYSQIDETHAHLNIPATFMYAASLSDREIQVRFKVREDLQWKIATQLPKVKGTTYTAPNLYYFMDSPTEISDFKLREFTVDGQTIRLALHDTSTEEAADAYFEKAKKVVLAQKEVFGTLPTFDYGSYTFLACYAPHVSGDGMEHRNSTILTSNTPLAKGGIDRNISTLSHEFFHSWNVERIRPKSLEPFDFEEANMSGELWFAEGFTSYYTNLILCRAGLLSPEKYVDGLNRTFNYVWNSPARAYFNPVEMSFQAPFVDAATSVDPVNRENTFISYYSYGSILGLALDISLRENQLHLDDYMKLVWENHGKNEVPYTLQNLHQLLSQYAGKELANDFFNNYIYDSKMPPYKELLSTVGVHLSQNTKRPYFGANVTITDDSIGKIRSNTLLGGPAYLAGLEQGDILTAVNGKPIDAKVSFNDFITESFVPGDTLTLAFTRFGSTKKTKVVLTTDPTYTLQLFESRGQTPSKNIRKARAAWLKTN